MFGVRSVLISDAVNAIVGNIALILTAPRRGSYAVLGPGDFPVEVQIAKWLSGEGERFAGPLAVLKAKLAEVFQELDEAAVSGKDDDDDDDELDSAQLPSNKYNQLILEIANLMRNDTLLSAKDQDRVKRAAKQRVQTYLQELGAQGDALLRVLARHSRMLGEASADWYTYRIKSDKAHGLSQSQRADTLSSSSSTSPDTLPATVPDDEEEEDEAEREQEQEGKAEEADEETQEDVLQYQMLRLARLLDKGYRSFRVRLCVDPHMVKHPAVDSELMVNRHASSGRVTIELFANAARGKTVQRRNLQRIAKALREKGLAAVRCNSDGSARIFSPADNIYAIEIESISEPGLQSTVMQHVQCEVSQDKLLHRVNKMLWKDNPELDFAVPFERNVADRYKADVCHVERESVLERNADILIKVAYPSDGRSFDVVKETIATCLTEFITRSEGDNLAVAVDEIDGQLEEGLLCVFRLRGINKRAIHDLYELHYQPIYAARAAQAQESEQAAAATAGAVAAVVSGSDANTEGGEYPDPFAGLECLESLEPVGDDSDHSGDKAVAASSSSSSSAATAAVSMAVAAAAPTAASAASASGDAGHHPVVASPHAWHSRSPAADSGRQRKRLRAMQEQRDPEDEARAQQERRSPSPTG